MEKQTNFATFVYEKQDRRLVEELSRHLDLKASKIFDFFDISLPIQKPIINFIPTKKEFDEIWKKAWRFDEDYQVPKSSRGFFKQDKITLLSFNDMKNTTHVFENKPQAFEDYKKLLIHEYVHYINKLFNIKNNCGETAKYLSEGIAVYLSDQKETTSIDFTFSLEQIEQSDVQKYCYDGWFLMVKYLVENYEKDFILQLFESNRQAMEFLEKELYSKAKKHYGIRKNLC